MCAKIPNTVFGFFDTLWPQNRKDTLCSGPRPDWARVRPRFILSTCSFLRRGTKRAQALLMASTRLGRRKEAKRRLSSSTMTCVFHGKVSKRVNKRGAHPKGVMRTDNIVYRNTLQFLYSLHFMTLLLLTSRFGTKSTSFIIPISWTFHIINYLVFALLFKSPIYFFLGLKVKISAHRLWMMRFSKMTWTCFLLSYFCVHV